MTTTKEKEMSAPKPELTTQERAEKMVREQYETEQWHALDVVRVWSEAVRLQAELLEKESGEIEEGQ